MKSNDHEILAFCHIIKTAGTTFTDLLKDNFGPSHLNVEPYNHAEVYTARELKRDLKYMPWLNSLAGHGLRPYVDYGSYNEQLKWITWLRDPVARLISGYQHGVEKNGLRTPFEKWLQEPGHRNLHVYFLSGDVNDLQGAKDTLISKNFFIGFVENFDQSLILLQSHLTGHNLDFKYENKSNTAITARTADEIHSNRDRYRDLILENTELDVQLYNWARNLERRSPQLNRTQLPNQEKMTSARSKNKFHRHVNAISSSLIRHVVYKPILSRI